MSYRKYVRKNTSKGINLDSIYFIPLSNAIYMVLVVLYGCNPHFIDEDTEADKGYLVPKVTFYEAFNLSRMKII